jgi:hypothetical protein
MAKKNPGGNKGRTKLAKAEKFSTLNSESLEDIGEPMGACFWVDNIGQNHCNVTTQSQCTNLKGKFFPGKRCPGGV